MVPTGITNSSIKKHLDTIIPYLIPVELLDIFSLRRTARMVGIMEYSEISKVEI